MKNPLLQKCALLTLIALLLLVPLSMIESTIAERTARRSEAISAIAASSAGEQSLAGPVLNLPVIEEYDDQQVEEFDGRQHKKTVRRKRTHTLTVLPRQLHLEGQLDVEKRAYGLHSTAVYEMQGTLAGSFELPGPSALPTLGQNATLTWGTPYVSVGVTDARGISGEPKIEVDGKPVTARRGSLVGGLKTGFHAFVQGVPGEKVQTVPFRIDLRLAGTGGFNLVPLGETTTAELRGNWPHPSFGGSFLPRQRDVTAAGFAARWGTTALASNADGALIDGAAPGFQVRLIDPVDIYRQATRAVKYGVLFIALAFAAFFMFEHLRSLPLHPIQYLLVGLAQAVFFLLLTSLSEHIRFGPAYAASAGASILLITAYLASVLGGWLRGAGFGLGLAILYAALYGILRSEQNALLLGSLLIFLALAALMLGTRRIDWYRLGKRSEPQPEVAQSV